MGAVLSADGRAADELRLVEKRTHGQLAVGAADVLLLATGAGWSADRGWRCTRILRMPADGARGLTYHDLCGHRPTTSPVPRVLGRVLNDHRDATPHLGYPIVRSWRDARFASTGRHAAA